MIQIRKYNISGRVQGVGFRAFVRHTARGMGLRGTVRNLSDGSVECVACLDSRTRNAAAAAETAETGEATAATGTSEAARLLAQFEERLRKGPPHSSVSAVQTRDLAPEFAASLPAAFEII